MYNRENHTMTRGLENDVVVFGGDCLRLDGEPEVVDSDEEGDDVEVDIEVCKQVLTYALSPPTLEILALRALYKNGRPITEEHVGFALYTFYTENLGI